jgi:DNA-binding transcriptional MocR family regulator
MLLIALHDNDPLPAYRQITEQIAQLIDTDAIAEDEILPPTRRLARQLNVSRHTVCLAYDELCARGYLQSTPGSYSRARKAVPPPGEPDPSARGSPSSGCVDPIDLTEPIDLGAYRLDPGLFPMADVRRAFNHVCGDDGAALLGYADPLGYPPLRESIAARLRSHSTPVDAEEILITNGALHGLSLVFRMLAGDGGKVIVESPVFGGVLALCRRGGVQPVAVPLGDDGMDPDTLKKSLRQKDLRFLFTIPSFHNPTGITTSQERRQDIICLCRERGVPIVEDAFEEEMTYFGRVLLSMKSLDGGVISLGTFSKVLFPGFRIGWIAAPPSSIEILSRLRHETDDGGSAVMQAVMNEMCRSGSYQRHLELINRIYSRRMQVALDALERFLPAEKVSWTRPRGGYLIWLSIAPAGLDEQELGALLRSHGVDAAAGAQFPGDDRLHLRLSIASVNEEALVEGIRRLGAALERA